MAVKTNNQSGNLVEGTLKAYDITSYGWQFPIIGRPGGTGLTGGSGNDTIENISYLPGGRGQDYVLISGDDGDDLIYNSGIYSTILGGAGNDTIHSGRASYRHISGNVIDGGKGNDYITNYADFVTISGGTGNDTIVNDGGGYLRARASINGGSGNDSIVNSNESDVTISGGKGNDTIVNDGGADVLFKYNSGDGNDKIYGFRADSTLSIAKGAYSTKKSGENVIVTVGKGKITLVGAASLSSVNIEGTKLLTVTDKTKSPVTVDAETQIIDASTRTTKVKITGNGLANTIIGGSKNDSLYGRAGNDSLVGNAGNDKLYGGSGNDTLVGGKGNDTLWGDAGNDKLYGGSGKDVFIYKPGEGTDTIFDYSSGDMLKILKSNGKAGGTFTDSSFKNGTLTLAIDGGGKVIFDNVSASDKFNINGTIYTINGKKLK